MNVYAYVNSNIERVRYEVKLGIIPCSLLRHWEVYSRYDAYKKMGHNVVDAVLYTSSDMRACERSVFGIIKKMEKKV